VKHWLVTGGCGFIGSHLVEALLARGDRVRVLDDLSSGRHHPEIAGAEIVIGDITDTELVVRATEGVDGCFHLAAVASVQRCVEDWIAAHRINLTGTITVFDAARRAARGTPIPVVYASSAAVYGDAGQAPLSEAAPTCPISAYGADKLASEWHGRVAWSTHGVPNTGLRFFNVYGPRQDARSPYSGVIAIFADRAARRENINIFGDGGQTRDFVYVGDAVRHLLAAMTQLRTGAQVFNVCTGRATSILDLAATIAAIAGSRAKVAHLQTRPGDIRESIGDPTLAIDALGLSAETMVRDGLRSTLEHIGNGKLTDALG
jgi:UDP-glucose 4-epimerase